MTQLFCVSGESFTLEKMARHYGCVLQAGKPEPSMRVSLADCLVYLLIDFLHSFPMRTLQLLVLLIGTYFLSEI